MLEDPETVLEDPGTVAVSLPLSSRADGFGGDGRAGLREMEKLWWMVETTDPVRVLAVIDGHSSADGGRYGLWVSLSVVKKDKRFLKGEGYASTVARRRKVQRLCWLCQWAERCGHQFWKRGDEK
ncbi:hypothetical protein NC652_029688 [Populus alba x Populus x berolinensis]|nr:hypothetical protein NC652_029688 [Populus alba x Populus x berolinensis]